MELQARKIGEKIRLLRTRRGLTQKDLAGEHITRNMLSLIENGVSLPSLASLVYLAEKLEVPVDFFFAATEEDESRFFKQAIIGEIRALYGSGKYRDCVQQILKLSPAAIDDEIAYLLAQSNVFLALEHAALYELKTAASYLRYAQDAITKTVYAGEDLKKAIPYYRELFVLLPTTTEIPERLSEIRMASTYISAEMLVYFSTLRLLAKGGTICKDLSKDSHISRHIQALTSLSGNRSDSAVRILRELAQDSELPYFMRFRVYSDLEDAAGNAGEFRIAYMAARKKLDLLENAKK